MDARKHPHAVESEMPAPKAAPAAPAAPKPAQPAAFEVEIYCVKCRDKRMVGDPERIALANGRPAYRGSCPVCGTTVTRIRKAG